MRAHLNLQEEEDGGDVSALARASSGQGLVGTAISGAASIHEISRARRCSVGCEEVIGGDGLQRSPANASLGLQKQFGRIRNRRASDAERAME